MRRPSRLVLIVTALFAFVGCSENPSKDFDILIRNGRVVDGTGNPSFQADIGIVGDTIVKIGDLTRKGALETIEAAGLVVSPGFIDVHTHADGDLGRASPRQKSSNRCCRSFARR